ncbi:MAG: hypothetical protein ACOC3S_03090 [Bacteroidota bacterium]
MKKFSIKTLAIFIIFILVVAGCEEEKPDLPDTPCIENIKEEVLVGERVVFKVCSDADLFTLWPGDEGHDYERYGQDAGLSFTTDTFAYIYNKPGTYNGVIIAVNQKDGFVETVSSDFTISVTETTATFEEFVYEGVFPPIAGTFEGDSIFLTVPFKTDLTNLVMNFEAGFADVYVGDSLQVSGVTANDFSMPVAYRVESWNGENTKEYVVVIEKVPPKTENELLEFGFKGIEDSTYIDFETNTIYVTVPFDVAINNLIAEFIVSETAIVKVNGVVQESGKTANNFLKNVKYSVVAEDGSTNTFDVVIQKELSARNTFIYFALTEPQAVGTIDNDKRTIVVEVPEGTDVSAMQPIISTSKGSTAYIGGDIQVSGESVVDFTNTVYYVVEAENGDIALYKVSVKFI